MTAYHLEYRPLTMRLAGGCLSKDLRHSSRHDEAVVSSGTGRKSDI